MIRNIYQNRNNRNMFIIVLYSYSYNNFLRWFIFGSNKKIKIFDYQILIKN